MLQKNICGRCFKEKGTSEICPHCGYNPQQDREKYPLALPCGTVLGGKYILGKVLGQGGFGITYIAQDYQTKSIVAVKEYFPDTMATRTSTTVTAFTGQRNEGFQYGKSCFLDEAKTLAEFIGNPNIVRVYSYFEENNTAYFVMEYVDGISLKKYLDGNGGKISWEEAKRILFPIMDALAAVHSKGIIHRDVSPENISITKDGTVKLLDFGAARYSLGDQSRSLDVILKHGYAPKEQYTRRGRQGAYTDVYSLAATVYRAITGRIPPDSVDRMDEDELIVPNALGCNIPEKAEDALLKALSVQPAERFQSMGEFKAALQAAGEEEVTSPFAAPANMIYFNQNQTTQQNTVNTQQNTVNTQQSTYYPQQNTVNTQQSTYYPQQNTVNTQQNTYYPQQNTVTTQQNNTVNGDMGAGASIPPQPAAKKRPKWLIPVISGCASLAVIAIVIVIIFAVSGSNQPSVSTLSTGDSSTISTEESAEDFEYTVKSDGVTIDKYTGDNSEVIIPSEIEGKPVTVIGEQSFWFNDNLTKVTIPDGVTTLGESAFNKCTKLASINIPDSVTEIGEQVFWGTALKSISIPGGVTEIKKWTFIECSELESVTFSEGVTVIGDSSFKECTSLTSVTFSESLTEIGEFAFAGCESLTSVTVPSSVTKIGNQAFASCKNLIKVSVPEGCEFTDGIIFESDNAEIETRGSGSSTSSGNSASSSSGGSASSGNADDFEYTADSYGVTIDEYTGDASKVTIPAKIDGKAVTMIGEKAFYKLDNLKEVVVPDSVTAIGKQAFYECEALESINMPDSLTAIEYEAFYGCSKLQNISIPNGVKSIGDGAFLFCNSLESITIPESVTSIADNPFGYSDKIKEIKVASGNKNYCSVDGVLFSKDKKTIVAYPCGKSTAKYTIPDSVTTIGKYTFKDCDNITELIIPDSVTEIKGFAIINCDSITSVKIPDSVKSIGQWAFAFCDNLEKVSIPKNCEVDDEVIHSCEKAKAEYR
ncbi:MAG: leucine-rich repeat protein [Acutalibacteraceae bacterium]